MDGTLGRPQDDRQLHQCAVTGCDRGRQDRMAALGATAVSRPDGRGTTAGVKVPQVNGVPATVSPEQSAQLSAPAIGPGPRSRCLPRPRTGALISPPSAWIPGGDVPRAESPGMSLSIVSASMPRGPRPRVAIGRGDGDLLPYRAILHGDPLNPATLPCKGTAMSRDLDRPVVLDGDDESEGGAGVSVRLEPETSRARPGDPR